ncbi:MAG: zinc-finger domain-containing protein [Halobacteria archaeon]|nr:zinc-finger domain-containing protein [Halobacteria archaeon]
MPNPHTAENTENASLTEPNAENHYEVTMADLPLHCPLDGMSLWNSHPRVYLSIEKTGKAKCPYCGADYTLVD